MIQLFDPVFIRVDEGKRSLSDARRFVDRHLYEYRDSEGNLYRKTFEVKEGSCPVVPHSGTHAELRAAEFQNTA